MMQLIGQGLHITGMTVTDGNNGMTAVHIQVLISLAVPNIRTFGPYEIDIVHRIYIEHFMICVILMG